MEEPSSESCSPPPVLRVLEALKQASHDLRTHPRPDPDESSSAAVKALLELDHFLSRDPNLKTLTHHLSDLKTLTETLHEARGFGLRPFLTRRFSAASISRVAASIQNEIQAWIDREIVESLTRALRDPPGDEDEDEDELVGLLGRFESRVSEGFDRELQGLVLKSKVFSLLESTLCDPKSSRRVREESAYCVAALIRFNKDVFVGQVLMGQTVHALIEMGSLNSIQVLCSLIKSIKSPLVDGIESNGEIPRIISFLNAKDLEMRVMGMDCVLEIGYFGRKEAIEAMLGEGLIEILVELQRSELGGDLIDLGRCSHRQSRGVSADEVSNKIESREKFLESHPFASCVARFAVQLEVGEGLRQRERRAFKLEILKRVREVSVSDAEAATIVAEVLWGSSP